MIPYRRRLHRCPRLYYIPSLASLWLPHHSSLVSYVILHTFRTRSCPLLLCELLVNCRREGDRYCVVSFLHVHFYKGSERGIDAKIRNAIECLQSEPLSKRATITFPFSGVGSEANDWTYQGMNKCCRELHM